MKKTVLIALLVIASVAGGFYIAKKDLIPSVNPPAPPAEDNMIRVRSPKAGDTVKSPLRIEGEARGNWFFEASFPAKIIDEYGRELGIMPVQAKGEWMTTEFVPFEADFVFASPSTESGTLILMKDNPSGLPENDDERRIPVKFDLNAFPSKKISLYYYDPERDKDSSGNIQCSRRGLVAVERSVPVTISPVQDAVRLLLKGALSAEEKAKGITTEFPLSGFSLSSASLVSGNLTLTFADPENKSSGGSCRAGILWFQIEATAKQFSGVNSVKFLPEEIFQP